MDLPLKPTRTTIVVDKDADIRFHLRPLDDIQLLSLVGYDEKLFGDAPAEDLDADATETAAALETGLTRRSMLDLARNPNGAFRKIFVESYIGVEDAINDEPVTVAGEPFNPALDEHFLALPFTWRIKLFEGMVTQNFNKTAELVKNSETPASR